MEQKTKILLTLALIFVGLGLLLILQTRELGQLRLIFCDVGQGDGILVITPGGRQVLVDGGPGTKIVDCLGAKMPFWDRTIELMVLTHPQKDHLEGLIEVLARYKVKMIATTGVKNETAVFGAWQKALDNEKAKVYQPKAGDRLLIDRVAIDVIWPTAERLSFWQTDLPKELNESSIVMKVSYGPSTHSINTQGRTEWNRSTTSLRASQICVYLTGDIPKEILQGLVDKKCPILKVSHHGSKTGTSQEVIDSANPAVAIIQVGKNSFGHPHKEVLDLLQSKGVKILRNDTNGVIEITSDGRQVDIDN